MNTRNLRRLLSVIVSLAICVSVFAACDRDNTPETDPREEKYAEAYTLLENRDYEAAYALFTELGDYKDAATEAAYFRYMPISHYVEYLSDEESDTVSYTVTLNDQNLPATVVEEYGSGYKHTCTFTYNELGYVTRRACSDSDGVTTLYEATYDADGNLIHETRTDKDGNVSEFDGTYNEDGQLITVVTKNAPEYYLTYTCTYDEDGREIKEVYEYEDETHIEEYTYNADGNLLKKTWATADEGVSSINDYKYDEKGRLVEILFTEDGEDGGYRKLTYDDKDQLVNEYVVYTFGYEFNSVYEYDDHGNVIKITYTYLGGDDSAYSDVTESTYKLVYFPYDYTEEGWDELYDSTLCWSSSH